MNLLGLIRVAVCALRTNGLRSVLSVLGIGIGVGVVIAMIAIGTGAQERLEARIHTIGANQIVIVSASATARGVRQGNGSKRTVTEYDAYAIDQQVPAVQAADPGMGGWWQVIGGSKNWFTGLWGASHKHFEVRDHKVVAGRPFGELDVRGSAKVAVIGQTVSRKLFGDANPIGQTIRVNNVPLTVIGLLERKGASVDGNDQDNGILLPISTLRKRIMGTAQFPGRTVEGIWVKVRDHTRMAEAMEDIRALLRHRHRLQPGQHDDFVLKNMTEIMRAREESSRATALLLAVIASLSLLVGGIGVMNMMLVSVTERTREIGLRMAVGAQRRDILVQFLVESVVLALIGGFSGITVGILGSYALGYLMNWPITIGLEPIAIAIGVTSTIGVLFGLYPAHQASRQSPVEALRYE